MKRKAKELTDEQRIETLDALYTAASSLKGRSAMKLFLRDLLTESERIMLGRRIIIARKLIAGEPYDAIEEELRVGRDTIWRVQRWLFDQLPGYEKAIAEMEKSSLAESRNMKTKNSTLRALSTGLRKNTRSTFSCFHGLRINKLSLIYQTRVECSF